MPVISRQYDYLRRQKNGEFNARMSFVDHNGDTHYRGPIRGIPSETDTDALLANVDLAEQLKQHEQQVVIQMAMSGESILTYVWAEQTQREGMIVLLKHFAEGDATKAKAYADIVSRVNPSQIASLLGITVAAATGVRDWASESKQAVDDIAIARGKADLALEEVGI